MLLPENLEQYRRIAAGRKAQWLLDSFPGKLEAHLVMIHQENPVFAVEVQDELKKRGIHVEIKEPECEDAHHSGDSLAVRLGIVPAPKPCDEPIATPEDSISDGSEHNDSVP